MEIIRARAWGHSIQGPVAAQVADASQVDMWAKGHFRIGVSPRYFTVSDHESTRPERDEVRLCFRQIYVFA